MKKIIFLGVVALALFTEAVLLSAQESTPDPVVIVPGIAGSWNWSVMLSNTATSSTGWKFMPTTKEYDNLIKSFEDKGYVRDQNLFVAFYDWRKDNLNSAITYLVPTIDKALANSESGKVDIVAHSMGGVVARSYIQSGAYRDDIDQLILLGTPNFGSSDSYSLWEGGLVPDNWSPGQQILMNLYLWYMTTATSQTADNYDTIHNHVASIQQLLPTYNYLLEDGATEPKPVYEMTEKNTFLGRLNWELPNPVARVRNITVIAGQGEQTVGNIPVIDRPASETKLWVDGIPEPNPPEKNSAAGDNRVLLSSAYLPEEWGFPFPVLVEKPKTFFQKLARALLPSAYADEFNLSLDQFTITGKHGQLPTIAIPEIMNALGLSAPTNTYTPAEEPENVTTFWFASPVEPTVTDPTGKKISKNLNEIPGAFYSGEDDPQGVKMIVIPNPQDGTYNVNLKGNGNGGYHMGIGNFNESTDSPIVTKEGTIQTDQVISYNVTYDSATLEDPVEVSEPLVEEDEISEMIAHLAQDVKDAAAQNKIKNRLDKVWLVQLRIAEEAAKQLEKIENTAGRAAEVKKRVLKQLITLQLKAFIEEVKRAQKKGWVDATTSASLQAEAQVILGKL